MMFAAGLEHTFEEGVLEGTEVLYLVDEDPIREVAEGEVAQDYVP